MHLEGFCAGDAKKDIQSAGSEDSTTDRPNQKAQNPWTSEELAKLKKGLDKFPVGTRLRWDAIAEYVGRSSDEVCDMVYTEFKTRCIRVLL